MKIAVFDYAKEAVDILIVDTAYIEDCYDGMTQDYLSDLGYDLDNIDFMTNFKGIHIIDPDEVNQIS